MRDRLIKVLNVGMASYSGSHKWEIGKWYSVDGKIEMCHNGFHGSRNAVDAMLYFSPEYICFADVRGDSIIHENKECWQSMRIASAYRWRKEDSVKLAIYATRLTIGIWEESYPDDNRPQEAIDAAERWLENPTKKNAYAADAAAYAARDAADAADSAYVTDADHAALVLMAARAAMAASHVAWAAYAANLDDTTRAATYAVCAVDAIDTASTTSGEAKTKCHDYVMAIVDGDGIV